ncbi:MAG: hypothetical protein NUV53_01920, partial [Patescibacteria group bacterium]|nr:hypothetical protein [Patescibacteria group bacterium]
FITILSMSLAETRTCQSCRASFEIDAQDFAFYEKIKVPPPTWCPSCRFMRRLSFYQERNLYKRTCDLCNKETLSHLHPDIKNVYCPRCWFSDDWDPGSFSREYDPNTPFMQQVAELIRDTPKIARSVEQSTLVNSDYINHAGMCKNCYLIFDSDHCENVLYSTFLVEVKDTMDCFALINSELCYGNVVCGRCSRVFFSEDCPDCMDVWFSKDCRGCMSCFGCIGLRKKKYHFFNEPLSKEEYEKRLGELELHSRSGLAEAAEKRRHFWLSKPHRYAHLGSKNVNVTGDYVFTGSKNSKDLYHAFGVEDSRYCQFVGMPPTKDCYDYTRWGNGAERIYESLIVGQGVRDVRFSIQTWGEVFDAEYCFWVTSSSHMFGCANIRKKEYCILNKQYSKESFDKLRIKIIEDMNEHPYKDAVGIEYKYGEFFPIELNLHAYNETQAQDLFPLQEEEAKKKGYSWRELPFPNIAPTLAAVQVPDSIHDVQDSILNEIIECELCKRPFRIVKPELDLLRRFELPVPVQCFSCRHLARWSRINPPRLWDRTCAKCNAPIKTSYAPDRPEIVYCEQCYNAEVV